MLSIALIVTDFGDTKNDGVFQS